MGNKKILRIVDPVWQIFELTQGATLSEVFGSLSKPLKELSFKSEPPGYRDLYKDERHAYLYLERQKNGRYLVKEAAGGPRGSASLRTHHLNSTKIFAPDGYYRFLTPFFTVR